MAATTAPQISGDFDNALFRYFDWQPLYHREKPYEILFDIPTDSPNGRRCNFSFKLSSNPEKVTSVRGRESEFELDTHGFEYMKHKTDFKEWHDREAIKTKYVPQMEELITRHVPGADMVVAYDWRLRNSASPFPRIIDLKDPTEALKPATQPHIDCSLSGCQTMIKFHLPDMADELLQRPYRLINVWRPTKPVRNFPLAVCDSRTVDSKDLVAADRIRREFIGEGLWALQNSEYQWYYLPDQSPDEVTLIKVSDSRPHVSAKNCVHGSFSYGDDYLHVERESLEMRMLIFTNE